MLASQDKNRQESQQRMKEELDQLSENVRKVWKRIGKSYVLVYSRFVCTSYYEYYYNNITCKRTY